MFTLTVITSSCSQNIKIGTPDISTQTFSPPTNMIAHAPTRVTTPSFQSPVSDFSRYKTRCVEIMNTIPDQLNLSGIIAYDIESEGYGSFFWDLENNQKTQFGNTLATNMAITPDYSMIAYKDFELESIIVIDANGNQIAILEDPDRRYAPAQWLNKEYLALNYRRQETSNPFISDSIMIFNLITGDQQEYFAEYPNFDNLTNSVNWQSCSSSRMVFDPSLSYVVYPGIDGMEKPLILWDQQLGHEVARIHEHLSFSGHALSAPQWSPNGQYFVSSAMLRYVFDLSIKPVPVEPLLSRDNVDNNAFINVDDEYPYVGGYELISVNLAGEINRLSFLTTRFDALESGWVWSPDGTHIAFWLQFYENGYSEPELAVLDVETGEVTGYCFSGDRVPIWSPSSRQLIVNAFNVDTYSSSFYLVDLDRAIAVIMSGDEDASAGSWLVNLP